MEVPALKSRNVAMLIVDDDKESLRAGAEVFLTQGVEVTAARSGVEGLARITEKPFDLILVASLLPDMSATQFREMTHRFLESPNKETPVLILPESDTRSKSDDRLSGISSLWLHLEAQYVNIRRRRNGYEGNIAEEKGLLPDFEQLQVISDGNVSRLIRFCEVYRQQFEQLLQQLSESADVSALPELRNAHHRLSTALRLLKLTAIDHRLRTYRDLLRSDSHKAEQIRKELLADLRRVVTALKSAISVKAVG
jgi:CheY-like chemotaxis protein